MNLISLEWHVIHKLRNCINEHWNTEDFVVLKVDIRNAFNLVSLQAELDECGVLLSAPNTVAHNGNY